MTGVTHDGMAVEPGDALAALGFLATSDPVRLTGGWDTLLWRFTADDGSDHVLRCFHLPGAAETARRERIALEACAAAGLTAPRIEAVGEFHGLPIAVQCWCPGTPLLTLLEKRPWAVGRLGRLFGSTQARLHEVTAPNELQATAPRDWASRVGDEYAHLAEEAISLAPSTATLIHLDYHPLNVVVDKRGQAAVIDWEFVAAGDPRADLAVTAATLLAAPLPPGPLRPLLNLTRTLVMRTWERGYRDIVGTMPDYRPLLPWAGAMLLCQTEMALGREGVWGTEKDLESLRRLIPVWTKDAARR